MLLHICSARCSRLFFAFWFFFSSHFPPPRGRSGLQIPCGGITQEQINMTSFNWQRALPLFPVCRKSWKSIRCIVLFRALFRPMCCLVKINAPWRANTTKSQLLIRAIWLFFFLFFAGDASPLYGRGADGRNLHRSPVSARTYIIDPATSHWECFKRIV